MRPFTPIVLALALVAAPAMTGQAAAATLNTPSEQGPTVDSEEVIAVAQRIKSALLRLQPCPAADVARYAIGVAVEGVKLEIVLVALQLERSDDDLCRGARRAIAQAHEDARLALASMSATGAAGGGVGGPPRSPFTFGAGVSGLGGMPGGGGGSTYRSGP